MQSRRRDVDWHFASSIVSLIWLAIVVAAPLAAGRSKPRVALGQAVDQTAHAHLDGHNATSFVREGS